MLESGQGGALLLVAGSCAADLQSHWSLLVASLVVPVPGKRRGSVLVCNRVLASSRGLEVTLLNWIHRVPHRRLVHPVAVVPSHWFASKRHNLRFRLHLSNLSFAHD